METSDTFHLLLDCLLQSSDPAPRQPEVPLSGEQSASLDRTNRMQRPSGQVEVISARLDQAPILANLLELYAHDFSEFHHFALQADGRFGYPNLYRYWTEPTLHPFLITIAGELAGFALIKRRRSLISNGAAVWDMAEFFVTRAYRRQKFGTQVAHALWRRFPGAWEVRVMASNTLAFRFWKRAISEFTAAKAQALNIESRGSWFLFSFESAVRFSHAAE